VPALDTAGAATTVTFTPRSTTSLRFTVTGVGAATANAGLAEIETYGYATLTAAPASTTSDADGGVTTASFTSPSTSGTTFTFAAASANVPEVGRAGATIPARFAAILRATAIVEPEAGSTPKEAADAVGVAPEVTVESAADPVADVPLALGTVAILPSGDAWLRIKPTEVSSVAGGGDAPNRVIRTDVDFGSEAGDADYETAAFAMQTADGRLFPAVTDPTSAGDEQPLASGTVTEGETAQGVAFFDVPSDAGSLRLVLLGSDGSILSTWSLSAR